MLCFFFAWFLDFLFDCVNMVNIFIFTLDIILFLYSEKICYTVYITSIYLYIIYVFLYIFLDKPWILYGIIILLSFGYILLLFGGIIYGCVKCIKFTKLKWRQFRQQKEMEKELGPIQLRLLNSSIQETV